jgi:hypothetical protein
MNYARNDIGNPVSNNQSLRISSQHGSIARIGDLTNEANATEESYYRQMPQNIVQDSGWHRHIHIL